jgi:hypothetical protein
MRTLVYGPWRIDLDRTNWKIGIWDVNILMLAVVTRRFRIPLIWTVLDKSAAPSIGSHRCSVT